MGTSRLSLDDQKLQSRSVRQLLCGIQGTGSKLSVLTIRENVSLGPEEFLILAQVLTKGKVEKLLMSKCNVSNNSLKALRDGLVKAKYKLNILAIDGNKSMQPDGYSYLPDIVDQALSMHDCDLNAEKLKAIAERAVQQSMKMKNLSITGNKNIEPEGFKVLTDIVDDTLYMEDCDLNSEKLKAMADITLKKNAKVRVLSISGNKTIEPEGFKVLTDIADHALYMEDCDVNSKKLKALADIAAKKHIKMKVLNINRNKNIDKEGFEVLFDIVEDTLFMEDCDLDSERLKAMADIAVEKKTKINILVINRNKYLQPEGYKYLPNVIGDQLQMIDCDLNSDKLKAIADHMVKLKKKVKVLSITGNKNIEPEGFKVLIDIVDGTLSMRDCNLNAEKLETMAGIAVQKGIKINILVIDGNKTIEPKGFSYLPDIVGQCLQMVDCNLNAEKLNSIKRRLAELKEKMNYLSITGNKTIEPEGFKVLHDIVDGTLNMDDCDLNCEKLKAMADVAVEKNIKLNFLFINENKSLEPEGFGYLLDIVSHQLEMMDCDLNAAKLKSMADRAKQRNVKLESVIVNHNKTMELLCFTHVADLLCYANIKNLIMADCDLTAEKLQMLSDEVGSRNVKLDDLDISQTVRELTEDHMLRIISLLRCVKKCIFLKKWRFSEQDLNALKTAADQGPKIVIGGYHGVEERYL